MRLLALLVLTSCAARTTLAQVHPAPATRPSQGASTDSSGAGLFLNARPEAYLLVDQLRRGGLVIFMRHAKTDMDGTDLLPPDYRSCAAQRNLSPSGRAATREVSASWRYLGIRISSAAASPFCRAIETATQLMPRAATNDSLAVVPPGVGAGDRLQAMLRTRRPGPGSNALLVGHVMSAWQAFGIRLQEGEALILEPMPGGAPPRVIGRVGAIEWGDVHRDTRTHGVPMVTRAATAQTAATRPTAPPPK
jgi:phosphohistidine phosphatase SixA